jgi:hypothetical protein
MVWFGFFEKNVPKEASGQDNGAWDAINAAIELRNSFQKLKDMMKSNWEINGVGLDFKLRCGINTGQAILVLSMINSQQWKQVLTSLTGSRNLPRVIR